MSFISPGCGRLIDTNRNSFCAGAFRCQRAYPLPFSLERVVSIAPSKQVSADKNCEADISDSSPATDKR